MRIVFHRDPVDIKSLCEDLEGYGAAFIDTTRVNFKSLSKQVESTGIEVLTSAVEEMGDEGDFHYFMLHSATEGENYEVGITENKVLKAIQAWRKAGKPVPHVEIA